MLLGQHCPAENPMQCCPRRSSQLCIRQIPVQCMLNTLGTTLHSWRPYAMLSETLQTTLYKKNVLFNVSGLCNLGPMQWCPRGSKQHCRKKKIQAIQAMLFKQHLVTLFACVCITSLTSKNINLCFCYYGNWLKLTLKQQLSILPSNRSNF